MSDFACPQCHAAIHPDLIETTGRAECPFCGADLAELGLPQPAPAAAISETQAGELSGADARLSRALPALPEKSRITIAEATDERLVIYIPGGGKPAMSLGCFAIAWNGFMCVFTPPWFIGMFQAGNNGPGLFIIPFLGIFWAVGLGMAWFAVKMRFERTFLLLDRDRLVVQRVLFNRKRTIETALTPASRAALVESYKQNDQPVYHIEVPGKDRAAKFGTALSDAEKDWVVDRINEFLAVEKPAAAQTGMAEHGAAIPTAPSDHYDRLEPADLADGSQVHIDEDSADLLQFHYPAGSTSPNRWLLGLFMVLFSGGWFSLLFTLAGTILRKAPIAVAIVVAVFLIPFVVAGLLLLGIGILAIAGQVTVRLTREKLSCRWHVGPLGYSKRLATEAIDGVRIESVGTPRQNPRVRGAKGSTQTGSPIACVVHARSRTMWLTLMQDKRAAREIASLIRTRLEDTGHVLSDV